MISRRKIGEVLGGQGRVAGSMASHEGLASEMLEIIFVRRPATVVTRWPSN